MKRASKLSFKMLNRDDKSTKEAAAGGDKEKDLPSRPSGGTTLAATPSSGSSSFFNVSSNTHTVLADSQRSETDASTTVHASSAAPAEEASSSTRPNSPSTAKTLPPIPRDYAVAPASTHAPSTQALSMGEMQEDVFESIGANKLAVRFEINIVKVRSSLLFIGLYLSQLYLGALATIARHPVQAS